MMHFAMYAPFLFKIPYYVRWRCGASFSGLVVHCAVCFRSQFICLLSYLSQGSEGVYGI